MNSSQNRRLLILTRNLRRPLSFLQIDYIVLWMKIDNSSYHGKQKIKKIKNFLIAKYFFLFLNFRSLFLKF